MPFLFIGKNMKYIIIAIFSFFSQVTHAEISNYYKNIKNNIQYTWNNSDTNDFYLPVLTWHNRYTYDKEHIEKYNEKPWGFGGGISKYDENGNWNGIYLMTFKDSFNKWEPIGGYGWEKIWNPIYNNKDIKVGLGYTLFITARDNWNYIPIPAALPLASIGYKKYTFQATYIPGTHNDGNVLFGWFRIGF